MDVAYGVRSPPCQQLMAGCRAGRLDVDQLPAAAAASFEQYADMSDNTNINGVDDPNRTELAFRSPTGNGGESMPAQIIDGRAGEDERTTISNHVTGVEVKVEDEGAADDDAESRPVKSDIVNGWFMEWIDFSCGGHAQCLQVEEVLFHQQSKYQDIMVFKSATYGNVLVLDGIINCTERDEFSYQEMLAHLALCSHPDPKSVLIIGGGDGGVAREVAKHDVVQKIVQCEIDEMVVKACREFIPSMAKGFNDPRHQLVIGDGFAFLDQHIEEFDVIITDSSDPDGPAETLFGRDYYQKLNRALKPTGLVISQGQTMWIPKEVDAVVPLLNQLRGIFPVVSYAYTFIPTYTMGQIGFILASKNPATVFRQPMRPLSDDQVNAMKLRYYNSDIHRASFVMPQFISKVLPV